MIWLGQNVFLFSSCIHLRTAVLIRPTNIDRWLCWLIDYEKINLLESIVIIAWIKYLEYIVGHPVETKHSQQTLETQKTIPLTFLYLYIYVYKKNVLHIVLYWLLLLLLSFVKWSLPHLETVQLLSYPYSMAARIPLNQITKLETLFSLSPFSARPYN